MCRLLLVAGVSGVGKTKLCQQLCRDISQLRYLRASAFVWQGPDFSQISLAKKIRDAADSQKVPIVLDGHLVIDGKKLPAKCIEILSPRGLIVVVGASERIMQWRSQDAARRRSLESADEIALAQETEVSWGRELAGRTKIPFEVVFSDDNEKFQSIALTMLNPS
jgi:adenylate kinase